MVCAMVAPCSLIAIVDDDPAMRQAIERLCSAATLPCRSFPSAEDFLASDAVDNTSLLIADIQLPRLSGFELHEQLTQLGIRLPVVFVTGQDQLRYRDKARLAGAAAYLTKPFAAADLIAAVRNSLPGIGGTPSASR